MHTQRIGCASAAEVELTTSSSSRSRNTLRMGEASDLLWPTATSIMGAAPSTGRLTTDCGSKLLA